VTTLADRLGTRILIVSVMPTALLASYVLILLAAGAPAHHPSLDLAITVLRGLTLPEIVGMAVGVVVISIATHPLQIPLIQIVEGYWSRLPLGPTLTRLAKRRFAEELRAADEILTLALDWPEPWEPATANAVADATRRQVWLPIEEGDLLPTALGNTLRAGEVRAGSRYGLHLDLALARLTPLMDSTSLADLNDRRNQLDATVRLCAAFGLATAFGVGVLVWHGTWLYLPVLTYLLCWASYAAAVAAARGFCTSLAAAVDLNHLKLFDALQLDRPADLAAERTQNEVLDDLFRGIEFDPSRLHYLSRAADDASSQSTH
jgi:hypothetical protein